MDVLVWTLAGIFALNLMGVGWLGVLELVDRYRLNKEIKELDALWRSMTGTGPPVATTPHRADRSLPSVMGARVGIEPRAGASLRSASHGSLGKTSVAVALAATVALVVFVAPMAGRDRSFTSASQVTSGSPESKANSHSPEKANSATEEAGDVGTPSGSSPTLGGAGSTSLAAAVPETVEAAPHSATEIHIEWQEVSAATGYEIARAETAGSWGFLAETDADETAFTDEGLEPATTYFYRVSATMVSGTAPASDVVQATTPVEAPQAPSVMATADVTTVTVTWVGGPGATGYRVERSLDGSTGWAVIATPTANVTTYTDAALSPSTTYHYRVIATNAGGESPPSNVASVATGSESAGGDVVIKPSEGDLGTESPSPSGGSLAIEVPVPGGALAIEAPSGGALAIEAPVLGEESSTALAVP
ncbi:MAG: fibronectin type III domain-containing protein [Actinomycetota bacterium]